MDRIIQPYAGTGAAPSARSASPLHAAATAIPPKTPADMVRAVKRRAPLIVVMTALAGMLGSAYVVRLAPVYKSTAQVQIEPPQFRSVDSIILSDSRIPSTDPGTAEKFVPNRLAWLQGRTLVDQVIAQGEMGVGKGYEGDPAAEIIANISTRVLIPKTNYYEIALEGAEPERVTNLLKTLLDRFEKEVMNESLHEIDKAKLSANQALAKLSTEAKEIDKKLDDLAKGSPIFAPGGKNLLVEDYTTLKSLLMTKKVRFDDLKHEERIAAMYPVLKGAAPPTKAQQKIEKLLEMKEYYQQQLEEAARLTRHVDTDPASKRWAKYLKNTMDDLEKLESLDIPQDLPDRSALVMAHTSEEIKNLEKQVRAQLNQVQETMPEYQRYQTLAREREQKEAKINAMQDRLTQFEMVSQSRNNPVTIWQHPAEPGGPVRPNRPMLIVAITMLGFLAGVGLVCFREFLDHSVKVPEHLVAGLTLPILTVIPRMRRLARLHRGGHLWTANDPHSLEADAYRNLRASLIGASGPKQKPIVTLMVTSAKAGEGKSTTALNLALTCARAGERTLLMDVDLRRPSLAQVFDAEEPNLGLVDVLRGDMPWQQAVMRTDVPNLNFLPTGDPTGVPIEVLGTLELRQLIVAVSGQYQRVILDAPAVLGLADCRMLGRTVDAAVLVVRSGMHELRPLKRAKEMLEQSRVPIAGVVFNGLNEGLDDWSSYGTNALPVKSSLPRRGLDAPSEEAVVEMADAAEA